MQLHPLDAAALGTSSDLPIDPPPALPRIMLFGVRVRSLVSLDRLSAPAAFPLFWGFEQEAGSMVRGALRHRKRQRARSGTVPRRKGLFSFREGLGQLTGTIAARLTLSNLISEEPGCSQSLDTFMEVRPTGETKQM